MAFSSWEKVFELMAILKKYRLKQACYFFLSLIFLLLFHTLAAQETVLQKRISINITEQHIPYILELISKRAKVDFTYNSDFFSDQKKISYSASNETLENVLKQIISDPTIKFKAEGNLIILYKVKGSRQSTNRSSAPKTTTANPEMEKDHNTMITVLPVYDTIITIFYDTLRIHDTFVVFDTVVQYLEIPQKPQQWLKAIEAGGFVAHEFRNIYKENETFHEPYAAYLNENIRKAYSFGLTSLLHLSHKNMNFSTGLSFLNYRRNIDYVDFRSSVVKNVVIKDIFYYKIDTLDSYYKKFDDTIIWYHIVDSSLVSRQVKVDQYDTISAEEDKYAINKSSIIGIPFNIGFLLPINATLSCLINGGLTANFIISDRSRIYSPDHYVTSMEIRSTDLRALFFTLQLEAGVLYSISETTSLKLSVISCSNLSSIFKTSFPVSQYFNYTGISFGMMNYF